MTQDGSSWAGPQCRRLDPNKNGPIEAAAAELRSGEHPIPPFHWEIEFPEVFARENGGFDAFVGNPPFLGGRNITCFYGSPYPDALRSLQDEIAGSADLVAHFFRRAYAHLRSSGCLGLIATNSISQGDTRGSGLRWIRKQGGTIFAARKRVVWPGEVAVVVSVVHICKGLPKVQPILNGKQVDTITAYLFHQGGDDDPLTLKVNNKKSFQGSIVLGMGFTFDDTGGTETTTPLSVMKELIEKDPHNAECIFPYLGGSEVNETPDHAPQRYVINFGEMSESDARNWPDLWRIVESKVKPDRIAKDAKKYPNWTAPLSDLSA